MSDATDPVNDLTGYYIAGATLGRQQWRDFAADILAATGGEDLPRNHILGSARFTSADASGLYIVGQGTKDASAANAVAAGMVFPVAGGVIPAAAVWKIGTVIAVNGTAVTSSQVITLGAYRVTVAGSSGNLAYTLSGTGAITEQYAAGIPASTVTSTPGTNRRDDFAGAGNQVYALGVSLGAALPSGCVMDVNLSLQIG